MGTKDLNEAELLDIQKPSNFFLDSMEKKLQMDLIRLGFTSRLHAKQLQVLRTTLLLKIVHLFRSCMDCHFHFELLLIFYLPPSVTSLLDMELYIVPNS